MSDIHSRIAKLLMFTVDRGASTHEAETARQMVRRLREEQSHHINKTIHEQQEIIAAGFARSLKAAYRVDIRHHWVDRTRLSPPLKWSEICSKCGMIRITGRGPEGEWVYAFFDRKSNEVEPTNVCEET